MIWTSTSDILCCQFYFTFFLTRKKEKKLAHALYLWGKMNYHVRYLQDVKFALLVSLYGFWLASHLVWKDLSYDFFFFFGRLFGEFNQPQYWKRKKETRMLNVRKTHRLLWFTHIHERESEGNRICCGTHGLMGKASNFSNYTRVTGCSLFLIMFFTGQGLLPIRFSHGP